MALVPVADFSKYDLAINGVPYLISWEVPVTHYFHTGPYVEQADDLLIERRDSAANPEMSENKLDRFFWDSQRSWHLGAGQVRFDAPTSSKEAFFASKGVAISTEAQSSVLSLSAKTTEAQATLLPATSKVLSLTNQLPAPQVLAVTDSAVFVAAGQPNLKRFSALDASDVSTVGTGTETAQDAFDLATDGQTVYVALGPDGTHSSGATVTTQREAFDVTTGWSGTGTFAIDTTNKKEGAASLKLSGDTNHSILKTGYSFALSGLDGFKLWFEWDWGTLTGPQLADLRIRLETDASNYLERDLNLLNTASTGWVEDTSFKNAWTQVGTPATITQIRLLAATSNNVITTDSPTLGTVDTPTNLTSPILPNIRLDDLRSFVLGTFTHFSDHDARVLAWSKDRLFGAGLKGGSTTQWEFFEVGSLATSTVRLTLPDGFQVGQIAELGPYIYFTAFRNSRSVIYCYPGTDSSGNTVTPFIAVNLPGGDQAISMTPFQGVGFLIGVRRLGTMGTNTAGKSVIYRAFPASSGHLDLTRILTFGQDDGRDYASHMGFTYADACYFGWSWADSTSSGLGVYIPDSGAYARHLDANVAGVIADGATYRGRRIFTVDGTGVYVEQTTFVSSGYIQSSLMDWNIDGPKLLMRAEAGFKNLPLGTSVEIDYSTDEGTTWVPAAVATSGELATASLNGVKANVAEYQVIMTSAGLSTPILKKAGLAALYAQKPSRTHDVFIRAFDRMELKNGKAYPNAEPRNSYVIEQAFRTLRDNQTIFDYQDPDWPLHLAAVKCRIGTMEVLRQWESAAGYRNTVRLQLIEIPP